MALECCRTHLLEGYGTFNADGLESLLRMIRLNEKGYSYTIVSILGPQSSGKKITLLDHLFWTNFKEMDVSETRSQTTKGVWIVECAGVDPCTLVIDLERLDRRERLKVACLRQMFFNSKSSGGLACDRQDAVPGSEFSSGALCMWQVIQEIKNLDDPTHKVPDYVPETIVYEILSRLPVKALMKSKSVCKRWQVLISDSHFLLMHLNNYTLSEPTSDFPENLLIWRVKFGVPINPLLISNYDPIQLPLPKTIANNPTFASSEILGPYHGIYCIYNRDNDIVLWNPSLRQDILIPQLQSCLSGLPDKGKTHVEVGFGFDSSNKSYKVLHILSHSGSYDNDIPSSTVQINVFNLGTKTWTKLDLVVNKGFHLNGKGCNVGSKYFCWLADVEDHFVPHQPSSEVVFSFDFCDEVHKTVPLPIEAIETRPKLKYKREVFGFKESIAVVFYSRMLIQMKRFDIWVMSEFGEESLWNKLFSIDHPSLRLEKPLGFRKNEELLIKISMKAELVSYDHHTGHFKSAGFDIPPSVGIMFYQESLLMLT